jgi:hypothetical protein
MKFLSSEVWKVLVDELDAKREDLRKANERIDRLTEALARKSDVSLFMPQAPIPELRQHVLEKSSGWFDNKPIPVIPPKSQTKG